MCLGNHEKVYPHLLETHSSHQTFKAWRNLRPFDISGRALSVAAEEARDAADAATAAVEELATQVATLMAALKAQITTLANTVAKIAKKVKA
jgi:hypothetical protein